jgi:peptidoglycan-associated lipoprotein
MNRIKYGLIFVLVLTMVIFSVGCKKKAPKTEPIPPQSNVAPPPTSPSTPKSPDGDDAAKMKAKEVLEVSVYFDYNQAVLTDQAKATLSKKAEYLVKNPNIKVTIEGHCDERGSNEYNLALGERRASAVTKYFATFGVPKDQMKTITYGKEKPVCFEHNESCWTKNRRASIVVN